MLSVDLEGWMLSMGTPAVGRGVDAHAMQAAPTRASNATLSEELRRTIAPVSTFWQRIGTLTRNDTLQINVSYCGEAIMRTERPFG